MPIRTSLWSGRECTVIQWVPSSRTNHQVSLAASSLRPILRYFHSRSDPPCGFEGYLLVALLIERRHHSAHSEAPRYGDQYQQLGGLASVGCVDEHFVERLC
jgi:hypothetical protein